MTSSSAASSQSSSQTSSSSSSSSEEKRTTANTIVIINPASGSTDEDFPGQIKSALDSRGVEFEIWETTLDVGGGVLVARAVKGGAQQVIACGGDGTIMSVVNGLGEVLQSKTTQTKPVLSIIPGGTANLLAGALGIPKEIEEAVAVAVAGEDRAIDLGRCGDDLFALGVGLGLTEKLVSQASAEEKEKLGKWAYAKAMLSELGTRPTRFSFKLDDGPERAQRGVAIVVANAGRIGGNLHFAPDAEMDDGVLDLCILHRFYFRDMLRMIWNSLRGQLEADRAVSFYQARKIEIHSDPPLDLQIDGEVVDMTTPLVTEVLPRVLTVRVPREAIEEIS
jgi:YegS/Rv2252/BmrU family lipid kinase